MKYDTLGPSVPSRIVVAGGCGGIGRELLRAGIALGHEMIVLDRTEAIDAASVCDAVQCISFDAVDPLSIATAVSEVASHHSHVDGFVFLCGYQQLPPRPVAEIALEDWDRLLSVNLRSLYLLAAGLLPLLHQARHPAIVTAASGMAYQTLGGKGSYSASKGGLISLTKTIAIENAPHLRANVVAPGAVDTEFLGGGMAMDPNDRDRSTFDAIREKYVASIPLGRIAESCDVVGPILFLLGQASSYLTGQVLHLNGGRYTP